MEYSIRIAKANDQERILLLMAAHAQFEGHNFELSPKHQQLSNVEALPVTIFVVEFNNQLCGYMSVAKQFSTWDMDWYLYLDCLYLCEGIRGLGMGLKLMQRLRAFAQKSNIKTIQWQTPNDNFPAIDFYKKLKAVNKGKQRFFWSV